MAGTATDFGKLIAQRNPKVGQGNQICGHQPAIGQPSRAFHKFRCANTNLFTIIRRDNCGPFASRRKLSCRCVVQNSKIDLLMPASGHRLLSRPVRALCFISAVPRTADPTEADRRASCVPHPDIWVDSEKSC